jgi:hypothetical protein
MNKHEYNKALLDVLLHTKQNWPSLRIPKFKPTITEGIVVPPHENKTRIFQGDDHPDETFISSGINELTMVMNIAELYGFNGGGVVDWGVGCGRMIRHMPFSLKTECMGIDIDPVNIKWCEGNIPFGSYTVLNPYGSIPLPTKSISLLYSYSVMTHLCESAQIHWLKEINKVLKGIAILSVHGMYSAAVCGPWSRIPKETSNWLVEGFKDSRISNLDISDIAPELYYNDIAHTPKYIYEVWNKFINVVDIIPGGFGSIHDAVVCTPKQG